MDFVLRLFARPNRPHDEEVRLLRFVIGMKTLAVTVWLIQLMLNPLFEANRGILFIAALPYLVYNLGGYFLAPRAPRATGMALLALDVVVMNVGNWLGRNPIPIGVLFLALSAATGVFQFGLLAGLVALAAGVAVYMVFVFPMVQPPFELVVLMTLIGVFVMLALAAGLEFQERMRERAEKARLEAENARARTEALLNASLDPMVMIDRERRLAAINRAAEQAFGVRAADVIGRDIAEFREMLESGFAWPGLIAEIDRQLNTEDPTRTFQGVMPLVPANLVYSVTSTPVFDGAGNRNGRLWLFRDITAEIRAEEERTEFMELATHELRAPLTSMKAFVDLMLDSGIEEIPAERRRHLLQLMQANTERWLGLVDNLLSMSRIESRLFRLEMEPVVVADLLDAVTDRLQPAAAARSQRLEVICPPDLPPARGDVAWLDVALSNLVSNAIKYTKPGGSICVSAEATERGRVRIAVRDTGIGMSEAEVASAFRKFYRARNAATADVTGSGLGLAITRTILERHRSTITLVSTPGVGSEFAFELEVFDRPPAKPAPESDELPVIASTG